VPIAGKLGFLSVCEMQKKLNWAYLQFAKGFYCIMQRQFVAKCEYSAMGDEKRVEKGMSWLGMNPAQLFT
jgi:hypothetical protein